MEVTRPKLGLALGGGAAKGWAHIGVMQALDEAGIRPDIVVGTSIGAVVGGCWAAGQLEHLEDFARGLTRRRVFSLMDLSFSGSGLITGTKLADLLTSHLQDKQIETLSVPFCCLVTELDTGHEIWLSSGSLSSAIRASYALPGIFQPVQIGEKWLVDGALVNPVPVSVCRAMGANYVIAVNLSSDVLDRGTVMPQLMQDSEEISPQELQEAEQAPEQPNDGESSGALGLLRRQILGARNGPPGISSVMMQSFSIMADRISRSRLAGDPPDLMISPETGDIGLFEFHRAAESIEIGYQAGQKIIRRLAPNLKDQAEVA